MSESDRERWNARHAERAAAGRHDHPSDFLTGLEALLPRSGRALDVAGGSGRHALWLAAHGLSVTLVDLSDVALALAREAAAGAGLALDTRHVDVEEQPLPAGPWDVALVAYFLHRPLLPALAQALAPGGLLLVAHPTRRNLERHPHPGPAHLLDDGELARLVPPGLEVVSLTEGWCASGRHEARLVARRPRPA